MAESVQEIPKPAKPGKKRRFMWTVIGVFTAYVLHLYVIDGSFSFFTDIFKGDLIRIGSVILTAWVIGGWYLLSRLFKNL